MIFQKYKSLIIRNLANVRISKHITINRFVIKLFKFASFIVLLPIEIIGDILFSYKNLREVMSVNPNRILIIKIDQLGDVLFSTLLIPLIKKKYPSCKIDYLVNYRSEIILKENPNLNKIYFWNNKLLNSIPGRVKNSNTVSNFNTFKTLYKNKYDVIINARAYFPSSNIIWALLRPKLLIGFDISNQSFLLGYKSTYDLYESEENNYLNLLKPLDIKGQDIRPDFYGININPNIPSEFNNYIVIAPVSFDKEREWSINNWIELIEILSLSYNIALVGLPNQREYLNSLVSLSSGKVEIFDNLNISELAKLIANSNAFIGIDSFSAHLAISQSVPTFGLVNTKLYYVKGLSNYYFVDGRSMLPNIKNVFILDLQTSPAKINEVIISNIKVAK